MLYIIAGASLSGKTTLRKRITATKGISGIDSDTLRTMTGILLPELGANHTATCRENYIAMQPVIEAFLHARSFFPDEDYILEGDAIHLGNSGSSA